MNGDLGKIYKAINKVQIELEGIKVRQQERHVENTKKLEKLENLPCEKHKERMRNFAVAISFSFLCLGGITALIITLHYIK